MKTIEYRKSGKAISDYKISAFVDDFLSDDFEGIPLISTSLVIDELRARIREGTLDHNNLTVLVEGDPFIIDKNGRARGWKPCLEVQTEILMRLIK